MKTPTLTRILSLVVPAALCLAAGCLSSTDTDDDDATATAASTESLVTGCHVQLPVIWVVGGRRCVSAGSGALDLTAGETIDLVTPSPPPPGSGTGRVRVTCNADGSWTESRLVCTAPVSID